MSSSSQDPIHILIVGTGAVGAFYGSRLHQPEQQVYVSLTCRSNYDQVAKDGLELETHSFGNYRLKPHRVFDSISAAAAAGPAGSISSRRWDFVVLCTKVLPDRVDDPELLSPLLINRSVPPPTLVLIQNGVGFEDAHRKRHPLVPILSAVTVVNAEQIKPALVRQNRWTRISIGPYVNFSYDSPSYPKPNSELTSTCSVQLKLFVKLLKQGGIKDAEIYSERELQMVRWHKLAINASMNPSSILSGGLTNSEMVSHPHLRTHLQGCMREIFEATQKIFQTSSFPSHFGTIDQIMRSIDRASTGRSIKPSMLVDWEQGRPLEIEVILGNPIRIAHRAGIELERIQSMYAFLLQLQSVRQQNPKRSILAKI